MIGSECGCPSRRIAFDDPLDPVMVGVQTALFSTASILFRHVGSSSGEFPFFPVSSFVCSANVDDDDASAAVCATCATNEVCVGRGIEALTLFALEGEGILNNGDRRKRFSQQLLAQLLFFNSECKCVRDLEPKWEVCRSAASAAQFCGSDCAANTCVSLGTPAAAAGFLGLAPGQEWCVCLGAAQGENEFESLFLQQAIFAPQQCASDACQPACWDSDTCIAVGVDAEGNTRCGCLGPLQSSIAGSLCPESKCGGTCGLVDDDDACVYDDASSCSCQATDLCSGVACSTTSACRPSFVCDADECVCEPDNSGFQLLFPQTALRKRDSSFFRQSADRKRQPAEFECVCASDSDTAGVDNSIAIGDMSGQAAPNMISDASDDASDSLTFVLIGCFAGLLCVIAVCVGVFVVRRGDNNDNKSKNVEANSSAGTRLSELHAQMPEMASARNPVSRTSSTTAHVASEYGQIAIPASAGSNCEPCCAVCAYFVSSKDFLFLSFTGRHRYGHGPKQQHSLHPVPYNGRSIVGLWAVAIDAASQRTTLVSLW